MVLARNNPREKIIQVNGCTLKVTLLEGTPPNEILVVTHGGINALKTKHLAAIQHAMNNKDIVKINYNWSLDITPQTPSNGYQENSQQSN